MAGRAIDGTGVTVDAVGDALKIRAPGFSFLKGDPLARLKEGRSVRVELGGLVLPAPGSCRRRRHAGCSR